jgi:glycine cleavage system H protein
VGVPVELKYTREHEWIRVEGNIATIGITDWAQGELGDIVFVELPEVGSATERMSTFGTIEAVKAVSDLFSPLTGKVAEINAKLEDDPMVINQDPYGDGWLIKIEMSDTSELEELLDASSYESATSQ